MCVLIQVYFIFPFQSEALTRVNDFEDIEFDNHDNYGVTVLNIHDPSVRKLRKLSHGSSLSSSPTDLQL